ncbi:hypothetical protein ASPZODRAFT_137405 [Penicilliopsis zonata CBS 506.65]|uniref:Uncharacterized protein n=1 Tax=Penicilliopsis zonata CBS 506.65 TaxID=1073090 RepID=A0A1L9S523_9EURO|nr:hypothetical protein ASPZODRAFT_137405 [Penicilliopsis zonata CBS 506.65]OJJ42268.1 hypothetical protein ASPZODRAFT_137405 [Penicilliopsis zonata CBS 506.65]
MDSLDSENAPFLPDEKPPRTKNQIFARQWPWILSTLFFALLSALLFFRLPSSPYGSYEKGFSTDLKSIRSSIELQEVQFTGGLELDENGRLISVTDPGAPKYAGPPSPEIDDAWNELMLALDLDLSEDEAEGVKEWTMKGEDNAKYRVSLDMYHSLHCLNAIRKALDIDYYEPGKKHPYYYRLHIDHCIDYLRQGIQCSADMTPLGYWWNEEYQVPFPYFKEKHTCRNFNKLRDWSMGRIPEDRADRHHH